MTTCVTDIRDKNEFGGRIMKQHKYWAIGAAACMAATFYSGFKGKMKEHKIFAVGAMVCMCFFMLSGHKMIAGKQGLEKNKEKQE